jgi:hypothetical protein
MCQDHLVEFDSVKHPLLNEAWVALEKCYGCLDRRKIYDEHHGRWIQTHGNSKRNVPDSGKMPVEFEKGLPDDDMDRTTELEYFLESIYDIEDLLMADSAQQLTSLQEAENAVNLMPTDIAGIQNLKEILLENVIFLREHSKTFRPVVVFFDEDATHEHGKITNTKFFNEEHLQHASPVLKPHTFTEIESFSKEFHKHAIPVLEMGKIPNFEFKCSWYEYLVGQIHRVAYSTSLYFRTETAFAISPGYLLLDVYNLAKFFEISHSNLFEPMLEHEVKRVAGKKIQAEQNPILAFFRAKKKECEDYGYDKIAYMFTQEKPGIYKDEKSASAALKTAVRNAKKKVAIPKG